VGHRVAQQVDRLRDDARDLAAGVDDRVPPAPAQCIELPVAIAAQLLDVGVEPRVRLAPGEQRQLVAARERGIDDRAAEKLRPAEDQKPDRASSRRSTSAAVL
jgi:hypothetical protein